LRDVSKQFGGTQPKRCRMYLRQAKSWRCSAKWRGAVHFDQILAEVYTLDKGTVTFRGADVTIVRHLPIASIHQDLGLIDWMTVAENICLTLGFPPPPG